jgi:Ca2+-binding EF-hand superfamily protein
MRFLVSALAIGALACAAAPAMAQSRGAGAMISMIDTDQDGRVTSDEWVEASYPPIVFLGAGLQLTEADYRETLTGTPEETARKAKENFARFDKNKDGFMSAEEFRMTFAADFTAMDTDKDGNLTAEEYERAQPR